MSKSDPATPFTVVSNPPMELIVQDRDGKKFRLLLMNAITQVRVTGVKDPTGAPIFEIDFQVIVKTDKGPIAP